MTLRKKVLNIIASLILVIYPLSSAAVVYAVPSLPSSPDSPSSPTEPESPSLPGEEESTTTASSTESSEPVIEETSSNTQTGADSTNDSSTTTTTDTDTAINNDAQVDNLVGVDSTTGQNDADYNSGDGSVTSGDATIDGSLSTDANAVSLGALECSVSCDVVSLGSLNEQTGSGSENTSSSEANNSNTTTINQDADLNNYVLFDADSGNNSTSKNTGDGTTLTGDAEIILTAINTANNIDVNYEVFNVYDDQTGDLIIDYDSFPSLGGSTGGEISSTNDTTGAESTNDASSTSSTTNTLLIDNEGNITNNYLLDANTGDNTADYNTGDGSITTGDANVVFNLINFLNNAFIGSGELLVGVVNIFGSLSGDIILQGLNDGSTTSGSGSTLSSSNDITGSDSSNTASTSSTNNLNIDLNNYGEVLNNVGVDATTGNNTADYNTGGGTISTGDSDLNLKVTNVVNTSTIGDGGTVWMVLINNLGTWTGQLFDTTQSAFSPFFTFTINPDGSLSAENATTGAESENNASSTTSNDTNISVNNNGTLVNNVQIDANTGGNSASKNTGNGSISTGDVNVAANIVNILNNTFIGGRFVLTIVNIFGSFLGDIRQEGGVGTPEVTVDPTETKLITKNGVVSYPNGGYMGSNTTQDSAASASEPWTTR